jgi:hypothetical protein
MSKPNSLHVDLQQLVISNGLNHSLIHLEEDLNLLLNLLVEQESHVSMELVILENVAHNMDIVEQPQIIAELDVKLVHVLEELNLLLNRLPNQLVVEEFHVIMELVILENVVHNMDIVEQPQIIAELDVKLVHVLEELKYVRIPTVFVVPENIVVNGVGAKLVDQDLKMKTRAQAVDYPLVL